MERGQCTGVMRGIRLITLSVVSTALLVSGCGGDDGDVGLFTESGSGVESADETGSSSATGSSATGSSATGATTTGDTNSSTGDTDTASTTTSTSGDTGPLLDIGGQDTGMGTGNESSDEYCSFVDIVFVIDNSVSMGGLQDALALAFPMFAETLVATLPPGVNVHVGVTSSEMGYSSSGSTSISNGDCIFVGENGMPGDYYYVTPDVTDTGKNGAQGRLFDPGNGQTYYDFYTDDPPAVIDGLSAWFASAAAIGTGGSNIEMTAAPAGWVVDASVNQDENAGFLRDEGAVLVLFFMTDEPDQTPMTIDGIDGGQFLLDKIADAKSGCGGLDCVIGGGFLDYQQCSANGGVPLDGIMEGLGATAVQPLPDDGNAQAAADEMNALLSDTLAAVIAETCDEIPPID